MLCEQFHAWTEEQVRALRPDVVVLATSFNPNGYVVDGVQVLDETERLRLLREGMARLVEQLRPYAGRFVVIGDPPAVQLSPAKCLLRPRADLGDCAAPGSTLTLAAANSRNRGPTSRSYRAINSFMSRGAAILAAFELRLSYAALAAAMSSTRLS